MAWYWWVLFGGFALVMLVGLCYEMQSSWMAQSVQDGNLRVALKFMFLFGFLALLFFPGLELAAVASLVLMLLVDPALTRR